MAFMARVLGRSLFFAVLLALSLPARADPLLMLLLNIAQTMASLPPPPAAPIMLPETYPGTTVEPAVLRRIIDDSFMYLSFSQRGEVFDALNAEILKPQNAAVRGPMIEAFTRKALEIRAAQLKLPWPLFFWPTSCTVTRRKMRICFQDKAGRQDDRAFFAHRCDHPAPEAGTLTLGIIVSSFD